MVQRDGKPTKLPINPGSGELRLFGAVPHSPAALAVATFRIELTRMAVVLPPRLETLMRTFKLFQEASSRG
jgi:hypothetical protein